MRQFHNRFRGVRGGRRVATGLDMMHLKKKYLTPGARVAWTGNGHLIEGVIQKVFTHRLERTIKGATVTQDACRRDPAYLIRQDDGETLLKNFSELTLVLTSQAA